MRLFLPGCHGPVSPAFCSACQYTGFRIAPYDLASPKVAGIKCNFYVMAFARQFLGNMLRHEYRRIDPEILWSVVTEHLDALDDAAAALLKDLAD